MPQPDSPTEHVPRDAANALLECARALFLRAGMAEPLASDVAEVLLEGDLLGHDTHGLSLFADPPGTILPLGGLQAGHKGYGLALTVEALTAGLAGFGRADPKEGWGATVFVQAFDPAAFGGANEFVRQAEWLREACRSNPPRPGVDRVRLPGERGLARRREQLAHGVALNAEILPALAPWAEKFGVALPAAL